MTDVAAFIDQVNQQLEAAERLEDVQQVVKVAARRDNRPLRWSKRWNVSRRLPRPRCDASPVA